ncbi:uncharacterized protein LOC125489779 [Plutella xylostella]|uniref:uncharacterized protein LOC125489779 n=1 Tax=Plutella xylostella TaxID=51655 RepID=UPI002032BDEF|nr:uncharacterized protein LOC125489779 [Plutella xylostella]
MDECGISGPTNQWFRSYLTNRTLRTVIAGTAGEEAPVSLGVPTGSVYGPVGYIMHVNSVSNVVQNCKVYMYADDMCLLYAGKNMADMVRNVQGDFENISKWAHDNGIILNLGKTKCMRIYSPHNKQAKNTCNSEIKILGHSYECFHNNKIACKCNKLELVNSFKYLGLLIDQNFNWKLHVNEVCNRLRSILGKFYYLNRILNKHTLYVVYYALADSLMSYGLGCYGLTFKTYLDQIKQVQLRLIKYLTDKKTKDKCKSDYYQLFNICKILPVHNKVKYLLALESYYSKDYKVPLSHSHFTRSRAKGKLSQPSSINYYGERTREYLIPKICNKYPILLSENKLCLGTIKKHLKSLLI